MSRIVSFGIVRYDYASVHPLAGRRPQKLFERKLAGAGGQLRGRTAGALIVPLAWTDRGLSAADAPLTYQVLIGDH